MLQLSSPPRVTPSLRPSQARPGLQAHRVNRPGAAPASLPPWQRLLMCGCVGRYARHGVSRSRAMRTCNAATAVNEAFEIRSLEGKGKGVVAKRRLQQGELILQEPPLLILTRDELGKFADADIEERLATLPTEDQESFWELFDAQIIKGEGRGSAKSRVLTNSYPVEDEVGQEAVAVFNTIARFNHSCVPNAHNSWDAETGVETIYVTRDIEAGQEICTTYLDLIARREDRQTELSKRLKFMCTCQACSLNGQLLEESDGRRTRLHSLWEQLEAFPSGNADGLEEIVSEMIKLIDQELCGHPAYKCRVFSAAFEVAATAEMVDLAGELAEAALENVLLAEGPESSHLSLAPQRRRGTRDVWATLGSLSYCRAVAIPFPRERAPDLLTAAETEGCQSQLIGDVPKQGSR
ncbi:set5, partial [Symbiodinium sp. CCMP2456]